MSSKTYRFECGCEFNVVADNPVEGGSPLLDFDLDRDFRECSATFDLLKKGLGAGIFQIESRFGSGWCKTLAPNSLSDLTALIALMRPGCLQALDPVDGKTSMTSVYCKRKNNEIPVRIDFPAIQGILAKTFQVLVYQEQQIKIGELLAGYSKAEADTKLRKNISKKSPDLLFALESDFIERCNTVGLVNQEEARKIFGWIKAAARYSFNECISPDSVITYDDGTQDILIDCKIGSMIKAPNPETGIDEFVQIVDKHYNGYKEVFEVETQSGKKIKCTMDHKFLCEDGVQRSLATIIELDLNILCEED